MLILDGRSEEVADLWASADRDSDQKLMSLAMAAHTSGDNAAAQRYLDMLEERFASTASEDTQYHLANVHAWLGNRDRAFELLMPIARDRGFGTLRHRLFDPVWRDIRDDPRWQALREKLGMSAERLDAIEFDPWLPV